MLKLIIRTLFLIASITIVLSNSVSNDQVECPQICPAIYSPVCATDGKIYKEFSNPCELDSSNCRLQRSALKPFSQTDMAWCTSTLIENLREKLSNLNFEKPECQKPCPMNYAPTCVSNGKYRATLSNKCELDFYNCVLGLEDISKHFKILKQTACNNENLDESTVTE